MSLAQTVSGNEDPPAAERSVHARACMYVPTSFHAGDLTSRDPHLPSSSFVRYLPPDVVAQAVCARFFIPPSRA